VERTLNGQAYLFVADRKTGAPVDGADVTLWRTEAAIDSKSDSDGLATLESNLRGGAQAAEPENVWILARMAGCGDVTPFGLSFASTGGQPRHAYIYTDRPVYRPGTRYTSRQLCARAKTHPRGCRRTTLLARDRAG